MTFVQYFSKSNLEKELTHALKARVRVSFIVSVAFFMVCMFLDFFITSLESSGDWTMEGNVIAQQLWKVLGPFRVIELFIWPLVAIAFTGVLFSIFKFVGLFWLNLLALNHLFGFISWLPYDLNNVVTLMQTFSFKYPIGMMSIIISLPLTLVQYFSLDRVLKLWNHTSRRRLEVIIYC